MITFFRLKVEGFKSISSLDIPLNTNYITLIRGANGYGKSTILESLVWVLYGKTIKGVSEVRTLPKFWAADKVYNGVKGEIFFQKDSEIYRIIRCYGYKDKLEDGVKGGSRLIVVKDGDVINLRNKNQIQAYIEDKIGLSHTLFVNSILFGQGLKRLIQESNADKKKIFEDAFNLQFLSKAKDIATEGYKEAKSQYQQYELRKEQMEDKKVSLEKIYDQMSEQNLKQDKDTSNRINELRDKIKKAKNRIRELEKSCPKENPKYELTDKKEELAELKSEMAKLKHLNDMPISEFIVELYKLCKFQQYTLLSKRIKELYTNSKKIENLESKIDKLRDEVSDLYDKNTEFKEIARKQEDLALSIAEYKRDIQLMKATKGKKKDLSSIQSELDNINTSLEELIKDNEGLKDTVDNYQWLIDNPLSNKGIKAYLFDSCLENLNAALDSYSSLLGFRIVFFIDLNTTRKDFDTVIEKDGEKLLYDELSGGEKQLVNVAIAFAMNMALTESRGLNLMFLDEVFESLDKDNIEIVINLIENIFQGKTLFLISHQDSLPLHNSKTLQVEKINGLSYYKVL